ASATSGRSCSAACTIFFEADALGGKEPPHRAVADVDATLRKLGPDLLQRQIRDCCDPLQQPGPLALQTRVVIATHRLGGGPAALAPNRHPIDNRCYPNPKHRRHSATRQTTQNRP